MAFDQLEDRLVAQMTVHTAVQELEAPSGANQGGALALAEDSERPAWAALEIEVSEEALRTGMIVLIGIEVVGPYA